MKGRNYTNFKSNLTMMVIYLPLSLSSLNSIGQSVFDLESRNGNVDRQTNGQMTGRNYTNFERNLAINDGDLSPCQV